ncbi:MAG: sugar phosphate isomerase/epimerase [Gemmatimonadota bacterium]
MTTRRDFVAASAAALLPLKRVAPLPRALEGPQDRQLGDIGLATITIAKGMTTDPAATLKAVAAIGYATIGLSQLYGRDAPEMRTMIEAAGLRCPVLHCTWADIDSAPMTVVLERAMMLGATYLYVPSVPAELWRKVGGIDRLAGRFNVSAEVAAKVGITLGFHNHADEFALVDGEPAIGRFLSRTEPKRVVVELDCYWVTRAGHDPVAWMNRWPGRIRALHVKDMAPGGAFADVGAGVIDWRRIFRERKRAGVEHVLVEHDSPRDELATAKASFEYLRALRF